MFGNVCEATYYLYLNTKMLFNRTKNICFILTKFPNMYSFIFSLFNLITSLKSYILGKYFYLWVEQIVYKLILWAEGKYPVRMKQVWVQRRTNQSRRFWGVFCCDPIAHWWIIVNNIQVNKFIIDSAGWYERKFTRQKLNGVLIWMQSYAIMVTVYHWQQKILEELE